MCMCVYVSVCACVRECTYVLLFMVVVTLGGVCLAGFVSVNHYGLSHGG